MKRERSTLTFAATPVPLSITMCTTRIARARIAATEPQPGSSYVPARDWPSVSFNAEAGPPASIDTGEFVIRLTTDPLGLTFSDRSGHARVRLSLHNMEFQSRVRMRLEVVGEQHFYGLGAGGHGLDRLGILRRLWNGHVGHGPGSDVPIPLLLSHLGYGLFFDNALPATIDAGATNGGIWLEYRSEPGPLDLYYLSANSLRDVLADVAALLGHAPMPPRWALGYMQSTRHFEGAGEWLRLPATIREKRLPCDALIFLSTYGDALGWNRGVGHLECEPRLLPEPDASFADLHAQHFHVLTHEYPVLHPESPLYPEAQAKGYLLDAGYPQVAPVTRPTDNYRQGQRYLDFSHPEVAAWWWRQHRRLTELGVDGWWLDGGEGPAAETRLHGGSGTSLHNRYDLMRIQAFAEGEAADRPDRRVFLLCRSGGPGMQQYGAANWSGDINATFPVLEAQPALGLSLGLSGVPYWGTDIGGFYRVAPDRGELFVRWFQFGTFCPVFRAHGWVWREHLPWAYGPSVEAICRRYLNLRYQLMPYTYTLAWHAHRHGLPLMRPLVLNYPDDPRVWDRSGEYLWGDDLLVAPVTREGATHWPAYLPVGTWYDFWTHEGYDGPCGITVAAPLDRLPLFVRAGAILPLGPAVQYHDEQPLAALTLLVYPAAHSSFTLYEDDGVTTAYRRGRYALTEFECVSSPKGVTIRIAAPSGEAAWVPAGRAYTIQVRSPQRPRRVRLEGGGELPEGPREGEPGWWHDGRSFTFVRVQSQPAAVKIEL